MPNLFWDSCVFCAWLYDESSFYDLAPVEQYLREAKEGKWHIFSSTVVLAEVAGSKIQKKGVGSTKAFFGDLSGTITLIDASPNILELAGRLKDIPYRKGVSDKRPLSTGDACMLATALHLDEAFGVKLDAFHTYDDGKKKPKGVPLLSYQEWCEGLSGHKAALARRVADMVRTKPIHPEPGMFSES
jgi:predicted nucleic acid-binding protein